MFKSCLLNQCLYVFTYEKIHGVYCWCFWVECHDILKIWKMCHGRKTIGERCGKPRWWIWMKFKLVQRDHCILLEVFKPASWPKTLGLPSTLRSSHRLNSSWFFLSSTFKYKPCAPGAQDVLLAGVRLGFEVWHGLMRAHCGLLGSMFMPWSWCQMFNIDLKFQMSKTSSGVWSAGTGKTFLCETQQHLSWNVKS